MLCQQGNLSLEGRTHYKENCRYALDFSNTSVAALDVLAAAPGRVGYVYDDNNRALILKSMGEYEKSAADFSVAIKLAPKNPKYYANRGDSWRLTGNLERALQDQDRAIELYAGGPGIALGLTLRGEFDHPRFDPGHPLRRHVLYAADAPLRADAAAA